MPFPWEEVGAGGNVYGWEPAEAHPGGRYSIVDTDRFVNKSVGQLASGLILMDFDTPYFYDEGDRGKYKTLLHGGHVQFI